MTKVPNPVRVAAFDNDIFIVVSAFALTGQWFCLILFHGALPHAIAFNPSG